MLKRAVLISLLALSFAGCGKKADDAPPSPPSRPTVAPKPNPDPQAQGKENEPPPPDAPGTPQAMVFQNRPAEALEDDFKTAPAHMTRADMLTTCVRKFIVAYGKPPKTLDEMVEKGILPRLPPAPAGKKFVYDETTKRVIVVNQ
jgi:hypothetical protein